MWSVWLGWHWQGSATFRYLLTGGSISDLFLRFSSPKLIKLLTGGACGGVPANCIYWHCVFDFEKHLQVNCKGR